VRPKPVINDVVCADSKLLSKFVKLNSVALTVTSPPYGNAINYSQHVKNLKSGKKSHFRGNVGGTLKDYLDDMHAVFSEVRKVTVPGGFCCIVIADELSNGTLIPLPSLLLSRLVDLEDPEEGWHMRDMIIWNKVTAGQSGAGNRFSQFVKIPVPTRFRANIMHEYIIVLQKGQKARMLPKDSKEKLPLNRVMKRQMALSIWDMTPVPPNIVRHPAVFPEQIPWRLIKLLTVPGDVVLDPMCGSGQTPKTAKSLGRQYIGVDLRKEYAELSKKRLLEKPMLSNFMIPLYFPIRWFNGEQPGGKDHAHLDVEDYVPKGFNLVSQNSFVEKEHGTKTACLYYKNKSGEFACCVIGAKEDPFIMSVGNTRKKSSKINKLFRTLPQKFSKHDIGRLSPKYFGKEIFPETAVADLLVLSGLAKPVSKSKRSQEYVKNAVV